MSLIWTSVTHVIANFSDKGVKGIVNAHSRFRRSLDEWDVVVLGLFLGVIHVDVPGVQVTFVANQYHRHLRLKVNIEMTESCLQIKQYG